MIGIGTVFVQAANGIRETLHYTMCKGDTLILSRNNTVVASDTIIYDTIRVTSTKTDSITRYVVTTYPTFQHIERREIIAGQTIEWQGMTLQDEGTYPVVYSSIHGCDSTYILILTTKAAETQVKVKTTVKAICEGDVFTWRKKNYSLEGVYYDTVFAGTVPDTIFALSLKVNPTYETSENVTFTSFPTRYRDTDIPEPGSYPVTYINSLGCDSVIIVRANREVIIHEETVTICRGDAYTWRGYRYTEPQEYSETIQDKQGHDSVTYILHLNVREIPLTRITQTICEGDSYTFGTKILSKSGIYRHTFTRDGCDSIVELSLNVVDVDTVVQVKRINAGESYYWPASGKTYNTTGTYEVVGINRFHCDSITRLVLTVNHVDTIDTVATICPGETLHWHTINAAQTGHYEGAETDVYGDMRYYRLDLTVLELKPAKEVKFTVCGNETVSFNGKIYTEAGHYYDKTTCDSLYHIIINQIPQNIKTTNASLPNEGGYRWTFWSNGVHKDSVFYAPGHYEFTSPNAETNCNDIYRLILKRDTNEYHFRDSLTLCEGEPFIWRGLSNLTSVPGVTTYTDPYKTHAGKDSIYELTLTILPRSHSNRTITFCGKTAWKGKIYTESAVVYDTLVAASGCDSIVRVILDKGSDFFMHDTATITQGEVLEWHKQRITTSGLYRDEHTNIYGCDSIYELGVGIRAATPQKPLFTTQATICEGDYYEWRGKRYENGGTYLDSIPDTDTVYALNLKVQSVAKRAIQRYTCENKGLVLYGRDYAPRMKTDTVYRDTIYKPNPLTPGCDSIIYLELYKYPVPKHTETRILQEGETFTWNDQEISRPGTYQHVTEHVGAGECDSITYLRVIADSRETKYLCVLDTPFLWRDEKYYSSGLWTDTVFDEGGQIREYHSLDLTITHPYDSIIHLQGCKNVGVVWQGALYLKDTTFMDTIPARPFNPQSPCDSIFKVNIRVFDYYEIEYNDTICEQDLPYILGRQDPDTIWSEGRWPHKDLTACGCDSVAIVNLRIIPSLTHNDSAIVCEGDFPYTLGNLEDPWFDTKEGGKYHGTWEGKWKGVRYYQDTIVWNCDSSYFFHVIKRPAVVKDTTYYLCEGDSVQLFWPKDTWIKTSGVHRDAVPIKTPWVDPVHGWTHAPNEEVCDSVTRWNVKFVHPEYKDTTAHKLLGDSIWWGGAWRYYTGVYDSIGDAQEKNSDNIACRLEYKLHLFVDTAYYFRDTVAVCAPANKTLTHVWKETGYRQTFTVGATEGDFHFVDSLKTIERRDSIYDLFVNFQLVPTTHLYDTICEGDSLRFDIHRGTTTLERQLKQAGVYYDTVPATYICDSILVMHLYVRNRIPVTHRDTMITDREVPYLWRHSWREGGVTKTKVDTLRSSGEYQFVMPSVHGCDSVETLSFTVHQTHVFRDTISDCAAFNATRTHVWATGYEQTYKTPLVESSIVYSDTLKTRIKNDSIYVLLVNFNQNYDILLRDTICEGDSLRFDIHRGTTTVERWLKTTGTYTDTLETRFGCDSVLTLKLFVYHRIPMTHRDTMITDREVPYLWKHSWRESGVTKTKVDTLRSSGEYQFVMPSVHGCDSIETLRFTVHQTHVFRDTVSDCAAFNATRTHVWATGYQQQYTTPLAESAVVYSDTLQTRIKYDSIYVLLVNFHQNYETSLRDTICEGDSVRFDIHRGTTTIERWVKTTGTYMDTLESRFGCDSVITLRLFVRNRIPTTHKVVHIPDTMAPYIWTHTWFENKVAKTGKDTLRVSGEYRRLVPSYFGCDSIDSLSLFIHKTYRIKDTITLCATDTNFYWENRHITQSGIYTEHLLTTEGYDSTRIAVITVHPIKRTTLHRSICEGEEIRFGLTKSHTPRFIGKSGIYSDTLLTINGCDSIIELHLQVFPQTEQVENKIIYEGDSVLFADGQYKKTSGIYEYSETSDIGCVSSYKLVLTVLKQFFVDTTAYVCDNELPFRWQGFEYHEGGDYAVPTAMTDSSRVVTTLHLIIKPAFRGERNISICEGNAFVFRDSAYTRSGSFFDTIPAVNGCDSIIKYIISVQPKYDRWDTVRISDKDTLYWHQRPLRRSGDYEWDTISVHGCDSTEHLTLIVHPSFYRFDSVNLCQGDTLRWHQQNIVKGGLYFDSLLTIHGFDSVYHLKVVEHRNYFIEQQLEIKEGYPTYIHGINISKPGIYYDSLYTIHGCDSIFQIVVNWARKFEQHQEVSICPSDLPYVFFGDSLTHSGEYEVQRGDSTIYLKLNVLPTSVTEKRIVICPEDLPYIYDGKVYEAGGVYTYPYTNIYRCDSTVKLNLVVTDHYSEWDQIPLCPGQMLKIEGQVIVKSGLYTFVKRSKVTGLMDSLYRVEVFDAPGYESGITSVNLCEGDTITFVDKKIWRSGFYTETLKTKYGCDSILYMQVAVKPTYFFPTMVTIADYQTYTWRGKEYTEAGTYEQSYMTATECDSTYQLTLTILPTERIALEDTICINDSLLWRGHVLKDAGRYHDTLLSLETMQSIIYTLQLHVVTPTLIQSASVTETAADVESFNINFTYSGMKPSSYSILFDELAHAEGFTDIINRPFSLDIVAEVPMPHKEEVIYQEHTAYVRPNYYTMRLALDNGVCGISRSDSLTLLIRYPSWILEQNWGNVVAPLRAEYNGGYEFGAYTWFVNDAVFQNDGQPYLYSNSLKPKDKVVLYATRVGESYAIPTAPLYITEPAPDVFPNPVLINPTSVPKHQPTVTIEAQSDGVYRVYSATGGLYRTEALKAGTQTVELPAVPGCCLIQVTTEDGYQLTQKIIIY